jgi:hypothetical protein
MGRDQRAERRAFIRGHHPDRGGDPQAFIDGLRSLDQAAAPVPVPQSVPVVVYRTRRITPARWLRRLRTGPRNLR